MQDDTGAYSKRVGQPALHCFLIFNRIEVVDLASQGAHDCGDVICDNVFDSAISGLVDREGLGGGPALEADIPVENTI